MLRISPAPPQERVDQAGRGNPGPEPAANCILITAQDKPYLTEIIKDIEKEMAEREDLEAMVITKRTANGAGAKSGH